MRYLLILLLTGCVTYKKSGEWVTEPFFNFQKTQVISVRITVHVVDRDTLDKVCSKWGIVAACTINGTAYIQGKPQNVTMKLSPEYINSLPINEAAAGDKLTEKLGLELEFNQRADLGHEFKAHIMGGVS